MEKDIMYKISNRVGADGKSEIFVRYPYGRKRYVQLRTGVRVGLGAFVVERENGGNRAGRIVVPKRGRLNNAEVREAEESKAKLQDYMNRLERLRSECEWLFEDKKQVEKVMKLTEGVAVIDITRSKVEELTRAESEGSRKRSVWEIAEEYLDGREVAYVRHFRSIMRIVHRWEAYRREIEGEDFAVSVEGMTSEDVEDLRDYMRNESALAVEHGAFFERLMESYPAEIGTSRKGAIKARGENAVHKMMKYIKAFWNWMNARHITERKPFEGVVLGVERYGVPYYLTIEERNMVADFDLSGRPQLAVQRDIFVFQCMVGCRVGDLYKLTEANITDGILEYVPHKTKDEAQQVKPRVPLSTRAQALILKYRGKDRKGRLFPFISEQRYNDAIKEALRVCGVERNVIVRNALTGENEIKPIWEVASSHMARRTFVGAAYSKVQDPNIVGRMSGHVEGSRAFARYREIGDEILEDVIGKIE